jgi:hypothetical protein
MVDFVNILMQSLPNHLLSSCQGQRRGTAAPTFLIFSRLDYYNTVVLYSVFHEYFD